MMDDIQEIKAGILCISAVLFVALVIACNLDNNNKPIESTTHKYHEETYTMKNGTPCTIIRGGSHSGIVGITCNYKSKASNND